jgi:hypothetical protein
MVALIQTHNDGCVNFDKDGFKRHIDQDDCLGQEADGVEIMGADE